MAAAFANFVQSAFNMDRQHAGGSVGACVERYLTSKYLKSYISDS